MDHNQFLEAHGLLQACLINQIMDRVYNSVGSNVFFEFGEQREIIFKNGKKRFQKEWSIWLSCCSWKISRHGKCVIGSGADSEICMQTYLDKLLGKRILSFRYTSQFLDLEICFEDDYVISTFFNYFEENQWTIFLPNHREIVVDCSSEEALKSVQYLSKQIEVKRKYEQLDCSFLDAEVTGVLFEENELSKIICTKGVSIILGLSAWRIEKNDQYLLGRKDYYFAFMEGQSRKFEDKLSDLIGKKIKSMSADSSRRDIELELEEGYLLEIFTHAQANKWQIVQHDEIILFNPDS